METVYVGLDLGSSTFQQVAMETDGAVKVNREFTTREANLRAAFSDLRVQTFATIIAKHRSSACVMFLCW